MFNQVSTIMFGRSTINVPKRVFARPQVAMSGDVFVRMARPRFGETDPWVPNWEQVHVNERKELTMADNDNFFTLDASHFKNQGVDINDLYPTPALVETVSQAIVGDNAPGFMALQVPLNLLADTAVDVAAIQDFDDIKPYQDRAERFLLQLLKEMTPRVREVRPELFPAKDYVPRFYIGFQWRGKQNPYAAHWDNQDIRIDGIAYYKKDLEGGNPTLGNMAQLMAEDPVLVPNLYADEFNYYHPTFPRTVHDRLADYTLEIPVQSDSITLVLFNNVVHPDKGGLFHTATGQRGDGWRRFARYAITDAGPNSNGVINGPGSHIAAAYPSLDPAWANRREHLLNNKGPGDPSVACKGFYLMKEGHFVNRDGERDDAPFEQLKTLLGPEWWVAENEFFSNPDNIARFERGGLDKLEPLPEDD